MCPFSFAINLYLNEIPLSLDNSNETDSITLPNGVQYKPASKNLHFLKLA